MRGRLPSLVGTVLTVAIVAAWFVALRPVSLGGSTTWVVIRGSSMLPMYETGDLVIVRADGGYGVGDVVAYRVPDGDIGAGQVVVHRLIDGEAVSGFLAQGDNNDSVDPWTPRAADIVGRAWFAVPAAGRVIAWVHQPIVMAGLVAAFVVAFIVAKPTGPRPSGRGRTPAGDATRPHHPGRLRGRRSTG